MYGVHGDLLRYAGSAFSKVVHFVNARQEDSASSELRMNEVAWPTFKTLFESGKEDAVYTYHFITTHLTTGFYRLVDVLRKISDVMKEWLFRAPQEAAAAVSALRSIRPSDPISPQISAAVTQAAPVLVALDGLYIASALGGGNTSLYGAILAAQAFQTQIPIVIKTFVGRAAQPALPSFPSSTHPKTDQFVMQMGLIGAAWVLKTGVSVISSSQSPVHAINTLAILAGTSPQIQHKVMETKVWKKLQSLSHSTSDQLLEFAKVPVKYGIRKSAEPMRRLLKTTWIQEQIRSGHYACVQEIHELFNECAAPLPQKEQENLWDFMSWVGQKKVMTSGKQAAQAAADILVDNMAEAIILRTCNYAKFMLSAQGFILGMQKLSERNRLLGAAMIVASGGKGQTVQTCAIRVLTAGAFYYTSSALATPLMYGFFTGRYVIQLRAEYYQDRRQEIIDAGKSQGHTDQEIEQELIRRGFDKDQFKEAAKRYCSTLLHKAEIAYPWLGYVACKAKSIMQKQSHLQPSTTPLVEGQENPLPPLPSETILDETPVSPSRSHNFAAQYFSTRHYTPLIFTQTGTASTAALTNHSVEPSGSAPSLAGTYFSTRSLRPFTFALAGKISSPFSAPAVKETTTPIMPKTLSDREECLLMWGV